MPHRQPIQKITRADGTLRYRIKVDAGTHLSGKRRQITRTYRTYKQAEQALAQIRTDVSRGDFIARQNVDVATYFASWLAGKRNIRATTRTQYADVSRQFLDKYGTLPLQHLTKAHMDDAVTDLLTTGGKHGTGRGPSYVKAFLVAWGQALDVAVKEGYMRANPARMTERPGLPLPKPLTWTPAQAEMFIAGVQEHPWEALWHLTMAGLRRGEVMGLVWENVNLDSESLLIDRARVLVNGKVEPSGTKTRKGTRTLPLWADLTAVLRSLKLRQSQERLACGGWESTLLAVDAEGTPIYPRSYADEFKTISADLGLPIIPLKNARHTSVTLMRDRGIPDHIVAAWHGHDETVMRNYYTAAQDAPMRLAAESIQTRFRRNGES